MSSGDFVMKIPRFSLRTTSLFVLISSAHVVLLISLNFYIPRTESKTVNTDQLQARVTNKAVFEPNPKLATNASLPSVKQDSKITKKVRLVEFRPESLENASVIRANQKITTRPSGINKSSKGSYLEFEANNFVLKTKSERSLVVTAATAEKGFKNYFAKNNGKRFPVYVYYGGYDTHSKPVGRGFLSYKFDITDSKYTIELFAEAMGWARMFLRRPIFFATEGYVSGEILKPTYYETHTSKRGKSSVTVVQASNLITFSGKVSGESFFGNIYDPLSLIFQIASHSKNGQIFNGETSETFQVFNRKKLEEIHLSSSPPEEMILPNGDFIKAVKIISRVQNGGKKGDISFWLDASYHYHPVRITFENKTKNHSLDFLIETGRGFVRDIQQSRNEKKKDNKSSHPYFKY